MRTVFHALIVGAALMIAPAAAAADSRVAGHLRVAIDSASHTADFSRTAGRTRVVVLHEWEQAKLRALKAADPAVTVLVYKNLSGMMAAAPYDVASTGVTTEQAASHPDWYLKNTSGQRFTFGGYGYLYAADPGNSGYQRQWADNVISIMRSQGWDGVFADDTNPTIKWHYDVRRVAKYPSDAAYGAATGAMLEAVGPRIRAAGKLIVPNFGSWSGYRDVVDGWLKYVDGGMEEQFVKWGNTPEVGYATGADWERMLGAVKATESRGKLFLGITHSTNSDAAAARYGWATLLLAAQGRSSFALHGDYTNQTWFADYDLDLGAPLGDERREASGVHRRAFANGLVLVNPTTAGVTVDFGGTYSGSGLTGAAGAVMPAHSALVLERVGGSSGTPAPTPTPEPAPTPDPGEDPSPDPQAPAADTPAEDMAGPPAEAGTPAAAQPPVEPQRTRRGRSVRVKVSCHSRRRACRRKLVLQARQGRRHIRVGGRGVTVSARRSVVVRVALSNRARTLLRGGRSLAVVVTARKVARASGRVQVMPSVLNVR